MRSKAAHRPLVTLDQTALAEHIASALRGATDLPVAGAYLFGSALSRCRPDSDIDVGLVPAAGVDDLDADWTVQGRAEQVLRPFRGHPVDVSPLRAGLFAFEVVCSGRLVYVRDRAAVDDFVERVCRRGPELAMRYRHALAVVAASVAASPAPEPPGA